MKRLLAALALGLAMLVPAYAAGTVNTTLLTTAYTDLGTAPVQVQALGGNVDIVVADSLPAVTTVGIFITPALPPIIVTAADAGSHAYALALNAGATIATAPNYAQSGTVSLSGPLPAGTNLIGKVGIDQTTPGTTNGVQVNAALPAGTNTIGTVGGLEFNTSVIPTVQNASYTAGQSLGGLQTISIGSTNGLSGILTQIAIGSTGGATANMVVYVWSKNPTGTTCTDKSNFVSNQTDNQALIATPQSITPALAVTAHDTTTYGVAANLVAPFVNGSSNTDLYVCVLANATVTPATTTDLRLNLSGIKDQP